MHQPPRDLFGEVPVLESEIVAWVAAIAPRWLAPERSYRTYVRSYAVADKIRAAKLAGLFDAITERAERAHHPRLPLDLF
jgi:hypothetical protein